MGATWDSWKTPKILIITLLQISALSNGKSTAVTGMEGQSMDFRCEYSVSQQDMAKYFCRIDHTMSCKNLIKTVKHNQWVRSERFRLYDNTTVGVFIVTVDQLVLGDSGKYWCGVDIHMYPDTISEIQLNVSPAPTTTILPGGLMPHKSQLPLVLTAVMCVGALLFVCVFTLSLLVIVKHQNSGTRQNREISSDYETMTPAGCASPELNCSRLPPDCTEIAAPPPPPELNSHINSKDRECTVTLDLNDYVDVDVPGQTCQYQNLDPNLLEEHIYHCLHPATSHNAGFLGVKTTS
ncbi:transmembrane domain-containing protein TMIGD3-like [Centroberyx affinis]|uniref:transmembrane domain-containing protein TMIGD3-like n=1 Tax=Centroberyx affinis TaxID=166261 RepID=UPI003A5BE4A9